jgi:hypothetical protein
MPKVKGSTIVPRLEYIKLKNGDLEKVLAKVNPGFSGEVRKGIMLAQWYDFDGYLELTRGIDQVLGKDDLALVWDVGRFSAEYAFKGIYKMFYKIGTPEWVVKMVAVIWKQYYDSGRAHVVMEKAEPGRQARFCIEGIDRAGGLNDVFWRSVGGWAERSLELSGGQNVKVTKSGKMIFPNSVCEFILRWE